MIFFYGFDISGYSEHSPSFICLWTSEWIDTENAATFMAWQIAILLIEDVPQGQTLQLSMQQLDVLWLHHCKFLGVTAL